MYRKLAMDGLVRLPLLDLNKVVDTWDMSVNTRIASVITMRPAICIPIAALSLYSHFG